MSLKMVDHPVLLIPLLLLVASVTLPRKVGNVLLEVAFLLLIYLTFTSGVEIKDRKLVVRIGKPITLAKKEVPLDDIVEIIDMPLAQGVRLVKQFQRPWVPLGVFAIGGLIGALLLFRQQFYGILWIYLSVLSSLNYILRPREKRSRIIASILISVSTGLMFLYVGHPEFTLGVSLYGLFDVIFVNEGYHQRALIIRTGRERIVLIGDSTEDMLEKLKCLLAGDSNVQAS